MAAITAVTDLTALGAGTIPAQTASGNGSLLTWLPALFFMLLGLFLAGAGLFMPQLNRRLGFGRRSQLITNPRLQRSARQIEVISRVVQILLGLGLVSHGLSLVSSAFTILNLISFLLLGLAVLGILIIIGITIYNWRA
ncbi:MAG: hypothetical protein M5U34_04140 [Chloroflexi bacterium]|nr:hypothetical protein [Chloroflexota bacterium]